MDRGPRASALSDHRARTYVLPSALLQLNWGQMPLLGPRSMDQRQGLLCLIATAKPQGAGQGTPTPRAPRLGPRPFSISLVNSFGGNFVWLYISIHASVSSLTAPVLSPGGVNY